jgi:diguanylate cyclase (GGDEF)-like protein
MSNLVNSVAELIDERDRESLEVTLARVTFELSVARSLSFWRAFERSDGVWLRRRVALPEGSDGYEALEADVPLPAASAPLRQAYAERAVAALRDEVTGGRLYVLPVLGAAGPLGLIEIETEREIDGERLAGLSGMLRIYRSHLAALDYGDTDELTGLSNRRTFDEQLRRFAAAEARGEAARRADDLRHAHAHIGVADIDFFKRINDNFGHPYGDEVLVLFSSIMRKVFRDTDKLFRFGGEEFVILMPNCELDDALLALERFRAAVEAYAFPQVGRVTVSIGVASLWPHDTGSSAFGRADQALYVAKREGRNRVLRYEAVRQPTAPGALATAAQEVELF